MTQIFTHDQILAWGLRWGWPGLIVGGVRLSPGRESYEQMDSDMIRLISAKIAHWNERMPSPECSEYARIEALPERIIQFRRKES